MTTEQVKVRLRTQAGKEYNAAAVDDDVRDLYKTNQFSNIRTLVQDDGPGQKKVFFILLDLPSQVQKVTFQGAKHIKEEELRNVTGIRPGMPLNPNLNRQGCRKIEEKYEEQGRWFAHCDLAKGDKLGDNEVIYDITECPKVKVRSIQFSGNTFVSGQRLAAKIKSSSEWFHLFGGTYNREMAEADAIELIKYYRAFGFQDVRVGLEKERSSDGNEVTLVFHIHEGDRYQVRDKGPEADGSKDASAQEK